METIFKQIIGKEITQEFYDDLLAYKQEFLKKKREQKVEARGKSPPCHPKIITPSIESTEAFIKKFIENDYEGDIHGGLIPEWIHLPIQWETIRIRLMQLPYIDFLKTYYWKAIRLYLIHKNGGHCSLCPKEKHLIIHHISYDHHGLELFFLEELQVLCASCHAKLHGSPMLDTRPQR